ncbi:ABC transporter ATP-binding protein [Sphingomicrobium nitratireducens]|uniref:ATP-binding cassette domain-containing protein n=1 Tax=Sphingomicrobium nitratireducens TaxID=2964666 RepID=UPI00223F1A3E|nr:ABC transporter ATP-binding protein [Sphingomicrobium nitratireducens]
MSATFADLAVSGRLTTTSLSLDPGAFVALIGPNGSGKTSLLRAMAGVDGTASARTIAGNALEAMGTAARANTIGLLPASRMLAWPIPVRDLLALAPVAPENDQIGQLVERLELASLLDRPASHLSTGERARVLLARVLANEPDLLLLDEPLANLDPYWALTILDLLAEEARGGRMVLAAMHDLALVDRFQRVVLMHEGRLVADGPPSRILGCEAFRTAFRLQPHEGGWQPA